MTPEQRADEFVLDDTKREFIRLMYLALEKVRESIELAPNDNVPLAESLALGAHYIQAACEQLAGHGTKRSN